jgi:uncharacterized protein YbjT (DUF2867 family)
MRMRMAHGGLMNNPTNPEQNDNSLRPILIVGGTGKTGRRVAERLTARGIRVRLASRTGSPPFDWVRPASWAPLLDGVRDVYLTYHPDLALPEAAAHIGPFARAAAAHGVRHIVLLSGRGEPQTAPAEDAVRASGAETTIVRCAWFAQNFSEGILAETVQGGELAFPAGDVAEPFLDVDDVADVVTAVLTDPRHRGVIHELTGPRLLTFGEAMAEISAAGRPVRYQPIPMAAYAEGMAAAGVPAPETEFFCELFTHILDGHNAFVTDGVERVLGRPARDFGAFARRTWS